MNNLKFERYLNRGQAIMDLEACGLFQPVNTIITELDVFGTEFIARCEEVESLPIDRLSEREGMLVDLLVFIVNHETEDGELTAKAGNKALESMDYWNSLDLYTKEAGFKRLGNGHFSIAYSHPKLPGRVIKVGLKKEDSGAAYVAFCRMHQGRAGIPVIHSVARHKSCYTVVMDELACGRDIARAVKGRNAYRAVVDAVESGNAQGWKDRGLSDYNTALVDTGEMIHKFFKGIASFDMHKGNIMLDKSGNIVVTDPVSFSHDDHEFSMDPEVLLAEVEAISQQAMIKRAAEELAQHIERKREDSFRINRFHAEAVSAVRKGPYVNPIDNVLRLNRGSSGPHSGSNRATNG